MRRLPGVHGVVSPAAASCLFPKPSHNRCLANWATVVCQKEELSTHWISLYLSYSHLLLHLLLDIPSTCIA